MRAAEIQVGLSLVPEAAAADDLRRLVRIADEGGIDLVGIQDHPYQARFLDTWSLLGVLAGETRSITLLPDVANLPLREPALMAKAAASLDVLSGGRFELGLGAGAFWDGVAAMGGPRRTPGESVDALEEAIAVIRLAWSGERSVSFTGTHYRLTGFHPGPPPAHPIGIWLGAYRPRMLGVTGRLADGWIPSFGRVDEAWLIEAGRRVDEAAVAAGRDPEDVRRALNVSGTIGEAGGAAQGRRIGALEGKIAGPVSAWVDAFDRLAEAGVDTFVVWPSEPSVEQVERLAGELAPAVRERVAVRRR